MQLCAAVLAFMQSLTANHRIHGAFLATSCMPRLVMWTRDRGKKHLQLFRGIIVESEPQAVKHRFLLSESTELLWRRARFAYVFRPGLASMGSQAALSISSSHLLAKDRRTGPTEDQALRSTEPVQHSMKLWAPVVARQLSMCGLSGGHIGGQRFHEAFRDRATRGMWRR
ncbi:hypothetical protein AK812_SmicGene2745 [Symbiodinium microadriaticum]|uniref:Uncharacterized protein n=1 Tax=Symbiodinium microadriaticum TaxID=2951 RepID=A0A1Q9F0Y9_SYMMI|nr:hypothetical protein AK812_SmicGene2745 [Symbiodinium microadriaticum]